MEPKDFNGEHPQKPADSPRQSEDWNQNLNVMNHQYMRHFDSIRQGRVNRWLLVTVIALCVVISIQGYYLLQKPRVGTVNDLMERNLFSQDFSLDHWEPFEEFQKMQKRMDQLFAGSFPGMDDPFPNIKSFSFGGSLSQQLDLKDDGKHYVITLTLPGLDQSKVDVSVKDQTLKISGDMERVETKNAGDRNFQSQSKSHIERYMTLPRPVKPETMDITYKDNTLTIKIEKDRV